VEAAVQRRPLEAAEEAVPLPRPEAVPAQGARGRVSKEVPAWPVQREPQQRASNETSAWVELAPFRPGAAPRQQQQSQARVPGEAVEQPQPMARAANGM
jgi:hypothetical protein